MCCLNQKSMRAVVQDSGFSLISLVDASKCSLKRKNLRPEKMATASRTAPASLSDGLKVRVLSWRLWLRQLLLGTGSNSSSLGCDVGRICFSYEGRQVHSYCLVSSRPQFIENSVQKNSFAPWCLHPWNLHIWRNRSSFTFIIADNISELLSFLIALRSKLSSALSMSSASTNFSSCMNGQAATKVIRSKSGNGTDGSLVMYWYFAKFCKLKLPSTSTCRHFRTVANTWAKAARTKPKYLQSWSQWRQIRFNDSPRSFTSNLNEFSNTIFLECHGLFRIEVIFSKSNFRLHLEELCPNSEKELL